MDALFKNAAGIIREARQSLLGIVALIILAVGAVSVLFFRDEVDPSIKIVITALLMLFFGLLCLGLLLGGRSAVGNSFEGGTGPANCRRSAYRRLGGYRIDDLVGPRHPRLQSNAPRDDG